MHGYQQMPMPMPPNTKMKSLEEIERMHFMSANK